MSASRSAVESRRLRTDPAFAKRWAERSAAIAEATRDRLARQREAGVLREDVPISTCWPSSWNSPTTAWCCTWRWAARAGDLGPVLDLVEEAVRRR